MPVAKQTWFQTDLVEKIIDGAKGGVEMTLRAIEASAKAKAPVRQLMSQKALHKRGPAKTETRSFRTQAKNGRWVTNQVQVPVKQRTTQRIDVGAETKAAAEQLATTKPTPSFQPTRGQKLARAPEKNLTEYLGRQSKPQAPSESTGIVFGKKGRRPKAPK